MLKRICDICDRNESDVSYKIKVGGKLNCDWKGIDICKECYTKMLRIIEYKDITKLINKAALEGQDRFKTKEERQAYLAAADDIIYKITLEKEGLG